MAFLQNLTPVSANDALYNLVQTLLLNVLGGVARYIRTSSTGVVYSQAGDVWTPGGEAVLANAGAWAVVRGRPFTDGQTTYYREILFQVDGAGNVRILYSPRATFVQGTPGAVRVPTASDQQILLGGGTDAAPTYAALFAAGGQRMQGFASEYDDTFWFLQYPVGGGPASALVYLDLPDKIATDSGLNYLDKDPAMLYVLTGANAALAAGIASESTGPRSVFAYGTSQQLWGRCPALVVAALDTTAALRMVYPGGGSSSLLYPAPTSYPDAALRYVRRAAVSGTALPGESGNENTTDDKGFSKMVRWNGGPVVTSPVLFDRADPSGQVCVGGALAIGHILLPWSGAALVV